MPARVFVDANVFFSRTQRDWLYHLRQATGSGMFTIHTSEDVIAETLYQYRRQHPTIDGKRISAIRQKINFIVDDLVKSYPVDAEFPLTDQNDLHVHAAATALGAQILLTNDQGWGNLPKEALDSLLYEVYTPDQFFVLATGSASHALPSAVEAQLKFWLTRNPDGVELIPPLREAECGEFADLVQAYLTARAMRSGR